MTEDTVNYYGFAGCYVGEGYKDFILHGDTIDVFKDEGDQLACLDYEYTCNDGLFGTVLGCGEFDVSGGDCQNRGVLYCR